MPEEIEEQERIMCMRKHPDHIGVTCTKSKDHVGACSAETSTDGVRYVWNTEQEEEQKVTDPQNILPVEMPRKPEEADFKITGEARVWKGLVGAVAMLSDEATLMINKQNIHIKEVDPAHVAMVEIEAAKEAFEEWTIRLVGNIGLDISDLTRWLADSKDDELVTIETKNDIVIVTTPEITRYTMKVDTSYRSVVKVPKLELPISFTLPFKTIQRTIKLLGKSDNDHITIEAKSQTITIKSEETGHTKNSKPWVYSKKTYERKDMEDFMVNNSKIPNTTEHQEERSLFPLDYLEFPFKTGKDSPWRLFKGKDALMTSVKFTIGTDYPIKMEAKGTNIWFTYLLAPRIETE